MSDPNWAEVLETLYENEYEMVEYSGDEGYSVDYPPVSQSDLSPDEFESGVKYLQGVNLMNDGGSGLYLKEEGFKVAHEREMNHQQGRINFALVVFTFALVLVEMVSNLSGTDEIVGYLLVVGLLVYLLRWTEVFDLPFL